MPIKSSVLIRTLSDHAIGSIREQLAADVERLEGYGDKIDGFIADNNRDEPPPECERKPLRWADGNAIYMVVRDSDNACLSAHNTPDGARLHAGSHTFPVSVVRVMEPTGNECPTERIAPEGCEWGILRINHYDGWVSWVRHDLGWNNVVVLGELKRFHSKSEAAAYISDNKLANCQPWPIPPKGGAE